MPPPSIAHFDGADLDQVRQEVQRFVPRQFRAADVEDRADGALAVYEREEVRGPGIERQAPQALQGDGEPGNG
jgi:hypothetical protein